MYYRIMMLRCELRDHFDDGHSRSALDKYGICTGKCCGVPLRVIHQQRIKSVPLDRHIYIIPLSLDTGSDSLLC